MNAPITQLPPAPLRATPAARAISVVVWSALACSALGMLAGLWLDSRGAPLAIRTAWCGAYAAGGLVQLLSLHWSALPATHFGMLCGSAAAVPLARRLPGAAHRMLRGDLLRHALCCIAMLAGMTGGTLAGQQLAAWLGATPLAGAAPGFMLGGMFAGMLVGGAAVAVAEHFGRQPHRVVLAVREH